MVIFEENHWRKWLLACTAQRVRGTGVYQGLAREVPGLRIGYTQGQA